MKELDFYLEKRVNASVLIPKYRANRRAWVVPADSYTVELWDALQASEARCKEMEWALEDIAEEADVIIGTDIVSGREVKRRASWIITYARRGLSKGRGDFLG